MIGLWICNSICARLGSSEPIKGNERRMTDKVGLFSGIGLVIGAGVGWLIGHFVIWAGIGRCLGAGLGVTRTSKK
jgi:hypothetical protein